MSTSSGTGEPSSVLYFLIFLVIIVALRIRRIIYGTRISKSRSVAFSVYYVAFSGLLIGSSFLNGVAIYFSVFYLAVGAAAAYGAYRVVNDRLVFWKLAGGAISGRGGIIIYIVYLTGLIARITIDVIFVPSALSFTTVSQPLGGTAVF